MTISACALSSGRTETPSVAKKTRNPSVLADLNAGIYIAKKMMPDYEASLPVITNVCNPQIFV